MAKKVAIKSILTLRRDTAANWVAHNPILAAGELGYETDTRLLKVGDGTTAWKNLAYIDIPEELLAKINAAKDTADAAKEKIDGLKVGGVNLLIDSNFDDPSQWRLFAYSKLDIEENIATITFGAPANTGYSSGIIYTNNYLDYKAGEIYTISGEVRSDTITKATYNYIISSPNVDLRITFDVTPDWTKFQSTFTLNNDVRGGIGLGVYQKNIEGQSIQFRKLKLERGNVATDWSPAPEDVQAEIDAAKDAADKAQQAVEDIKIGGVNLITNSRLDNRSGWSQNSPNVAIISEDFHGYKCIVTEGPGSGVYKHLHLTGEGDEYITSIDVYAEQDMIVRLSHRYVNIPANKWVRVYTKGLSKESGAGGAYTINCTIAPSGQGGIDGVKVGFKNIKVEKGNIATDWSPAPEDKLDTPATAGTAGQVLTLGSDNKPKWQDAASGSADEYSENFPYAIELSSPNPDYKVTGTEEAPFCRISLTRWPKNPTDETLYIFLMRQRKRRMCMGQDLGKHHLQSAGWRHPYRTEDGFFEHCEWEMPFNPEPNGVKERGLDVNPIVKQFFRLKKSKTDEYYIFNGGYRIGKGNNIIKPRRVFWGLGFAIYRYDVELKKFVRCSNIVPFSFTMDHKMNVTGVYPDR